MSTLLDDNKHRAACDSPEKPEVQQHDDGGQNQDGSAPGSTEKVEFTNTTPYPPPKDVTDRLPSYANDDWCIDDPCY